MSSASRAKGLADGLVAFAHTATTPSPPRVDAGASQPGRDARTGAPPAGLAAEEGASTALAALGSAGRKRARVSPARSAAEAQGTSAALVTPGSAGRKRKAVSPADLAADDGAGGTALVAPGSAGTPSKRRSYALDAPPAGWRETWELIVELRADRSAVVDSMGTEAAAAACADDAERAYHSLVSLMLSSQTKDTMNAIVMRRLRARGLSVTSVLAMADSEFLELIYGVGFHNNKVKYIKEATRLIATQHGGRVPTTMPELLALPGVGPKMAIIQLNVAEGQCVGISVDTHVHRICNQLGWTGDEPTKLPEKTREAIQSWMPKDIWRDVNLVLVGLGQEVQTEKQKLLGKCLGCSDPERALALVERLGLDVEREKKRAAGILSAGPSPLKLKE